MDDDLRTKQAVLPAGFTAGGAGLNKASKDPEKFTRGFLVEINENGSYGLKLVGISIVEAYGALSLVYEQLRSQLGVPK